MDSMAGFEEKFEKKLMEVAENLLEPSVEELLHRLDGIENCLSNVKQEYSDKIRKVISLLLRALLVDKLLKHADVDVKVAVAACISKIMRITSPDLLSDNDQLKEVFQLIISSFANLDDKSSRSFSKRTSILENMANLKSYGAMLDLECHMLVTKMFQHFLETISEHHPMNVFASMETIMTRFLVESNDISLELLSPIIDCLKKNIKVFKTSHKLAELVLRNSATKVVPYLTEAVKQLSSVKTAESSRNTKIEPTVSMNERTSEKKKLKQLQMKVAQSDNAKESSKPKEDKKTRAQGKTIDLNELSQASSGENERAGCMLTFGDLLHASVPSANVALKLSKDVEQQLVDIPKINGKRKRSLRKKNAKPFEFKVYGENLVGSRIQVLGHGVLGFFKGVVHSYDATRKGYLVKYDNGGQEILNLVTEKWEFIEDESETSKDKEAEQTGHGKTSGTSQKKKAETGKQPKAEAASNASSKSEAPFSDANLTREWNKLTSFLSGHINGDVLVGEQVSPNIRVHRRNLLTGVCR